MNQKKIKGTPDRWPFARLAVGEHFRRRRSPMVWVKRADNLADAAGAWRSHPDAGAGFIHPAPDESCEPVRADTAPDAGDAGEEGLGGLVSVRFSRDGDLCLVFSDDASRAAALERLCPALDPVLQAAPRLGREGDLRLLSLRGCDLAEDLRLKFSSL